MANAQATVRLPSNEVPSQDQVLSWLPRGGGSSNLIEEIEL